MWQLGSLPLAAERLVALVPRDAVHVEMVDGTHVETYRCGLGHVHLKLGAFTPYTVALVAFLRATALALMEAQRCPLEDALHRVWALAGELVPDNERGDMHALYLQQPREPMPPSGGYMH